MPLIPEQSSADYTKNLFFNESSSRFPWAGQWELTCRCNLKCVMCYTDVFNTPERIKQELSTDEIFRILDEIHEAGCLELTFTGGEPLSRPDFLTIYERAHRLGLFITVFTNGTLITEEIADRWAELRPYRIEISLHSVNPEIFDQVTQLSGSFDRCLKAIKFLMDRKIPLVLKTVGLTVNQEEILAVKRYVASLGGGVEWRFGQYLRDDLGQTGFPFQYQISEEDLEKLEKEDPELWQAKCKEMTEFEARKKGECGGGKMKFHIDAYGQLQLCSNNRRASYDLRKGSFRHGFNEILPTFPCPKRSFKSVEETSCICSEKKEGIFEEVP